MIAPDKTITPVNTTSDAVAFDVLGSLAGSFQFAEVKFLEKTRDSAKIFDPDSQEQHANPSEG